LFKQSVASHLKGHGCPRCFQSNGEQRVREILSLLEVEFNEQVRFPDCRAKRSLPFDFFVPERKLLIEFDGRQHYDNSELWGGTSKLAETQLHDDIKSKFAATHGYRLVRIPYWEYDKIEGILLEELTKEP
jgi:very-short-patch-repair endonuclease